jgi:tRNA pseudouridine55 synthase
MVATPENAVDGLINLAKPAGISSARALYRVRAITGQKKSGHAGTLDPTATGVLLLCLGKGTRLVEQLMGLPKIYRTVARLDVTSSSFDADREMTPVDVAQKPSHAAVAAALAAFEGEIMQVPPAVSAIKIGGRASYKLERAGKAVALAPRPARIYWIVLHAYEWPTIDFSMACGRGTYVRAIARDLGTALGTGGCLTRLSREAVGPFTLADAWTLERIAESAPHASVIPIPEVLARIASAVAPNPPSA